MSEDSIKFIKALNDHNLIAMKKIPKSDLHNHFVLGGNRKYIQSKTGYRIEPIKTALQSIDEMHQWNNQNLDNYFDNTDMRSMLIEATFVQAKEDGVSVLEIGEDAWGLGEYFSDDVDALISTFLSTKESIAPDIELRL